MGLTVKEPPRTFKVGKGSGLTMSDCGTVELQPDEQITLVTETGAEYDVARKDWGFYATPSLNGRLESFGLRGVLVRNRCGRYYLLLVERGKEDAFESYLADEQLAIVYWLDSSRSLDTLTKKVTEA